MLLYQKLFLICLLYTSKGKTAIPHDLIKRLCQEFNVSADYFYFETDKPLVRCV